ncbi:hypothetical protein JTB14_024980 [Gonioctena quinquepunctata]|nr:hypothetical protein JTB14_024980 [Gonioctena quinquepunctata]
MSELEEEPPETYNLGVYEVAPWEMKPPVIRFDCLKYKKDEAPRQLIYGEIHTFNPDPLVENILSTLHWLLCNNQTVIFIWIPSHIGIIGNERADEAAREAANSDYADNIPMRQDDIKVHIKHKILTLWQEKWSEQNTHLRKVKHTTIPEQRTRTLKEEIK